jgi:uncharacterized protein (DUF433 family)
MSETAIQEQLVESTTQEELPFQTVVAPGIVRRRDRGLCIAGTRISLYLIKDYLKAGRTPDEICRSLLLSEGQLNDAIRYIEGNREEFEAEYAEVVRVCEERERYYRERNPLREIKDKPPNLTPKQEEAWERLMALKREGKF